MAMNKANAAKNNREEFTFFWKEDEENGCFSQWYLRPFVIEGITYCCCEQYMMAKKALLFRDTRAYNKIMGTSDPGTIKYQGKQVKPYDDAVWNAAVQEVIYNANMAKFTQNEDLKQKLLATGKTTMAEASPYDHKYGIGLEADDVKALDPDQWDGTNLLGQTLMKVRNKISADEILLQIWRKDGRN